MDEPGFEECAVCLEKMDDDTPVRCCTNPIKRHCVHTNCARFEKCPTCRNYPLGRSVPGPVTVDLQPFEIPGGGKSKSRRRKSRRRRNKSRRIKNKSRRRKSRR
jgi:hypothetical protein